MTETPVQKQPRRVVCAAHRNFEKTVICSPRHNDGIASEAMIKEDGKWSHYEMGFVDQDGKFMDRRGAADVAVASGQVKPNNVGTFLFSTDLY